MLYVCRHGQSALNALALMCGRTDSPITVRGESQAAETGEKLKDIAFSAAFCSPLSRSRRTLEIILGRNRHAVPTIREDARIIERDFGYLEGERMDLVPEYDRRWQADFDYGKYEMESFDALLARVRAFIADVAESYADKDVLAVSHNGTIRAFRVAMGECDTSLDLMNFGVDNACFLCYPL